MPDGDKFEKRLPGKAWRQAYRLACRNDDNEWDYFSARKLLARQALAA
jgi:hypothetical protein